MARFSVCIHHLVQSMGAGKCPEYVVERTVLSVDDDDVLHFFMQRGGHETIRKSFIVSAARARHQDCGTAQHSAERSGSHGWYLPLWCNFAASDADMARLHLGYAMLTVITNRDLQRQ